MWRTQLKLRIALRMVKVDPATAKQTASEAIAGGVLESEDVLISKGLENEMWLMFNWGDCGAGASLVTMLKGLEDPRLGLYFTRNTQPIVRSGAKPLQETDDEGKLVDKRNANGFLVYADADYLTLEEDGQTVLLREGTAYLGHPSRLQHRRQTEHVQQLFGVGRDLHHAAADSLCGRGMVPACRGQAPLARTPRSERADAL